jgi:hypothetical protein
MFFLLGPLPAVVEQDLAAEQKKWHRSGGEQRVMIPLGLEIWDEDFGWKN